MEITCGTDIIEISRIKKSIENFGDKFLNAIFTENEIKYCESHKNQKYQHYAARFAAKEAIFKAISEYVDCEIGWKSCEILNSENGKPVVNVLCNIKRLQKIELSISHCKEYVVAMVVAQF